MIKRLLKDRRITTHKLALWVPEVSHFIIENIKITSNNASTAADIFFNNMETRRNCWIVLLPTMTCGCYIPHCKQNNNHARGTIQL
ncbi:hypothetical protein C0J52_08491 [Blattella germanica]|nr:hypothetical protein C0J52_08491 [Blattella germanica]